MNQINKLKRKLEFWPKLKKKILVAGLFASLLVPPSVLGVSSLVDANKKWKQEKILQELVRQPVPENVIADVKNKSLEHSVEHPYGFYQKDGIWSYCNTEQYKEYETIIKKVSEDTGVPDYVLMSLAEYCGQCEYNWDWSSRTPITTEEAGLDLLVLFKDPEQDFLCGAGKYLKILREVQDEEVAIALMLTDKKNIKEAKNDAATAYVRLNEYQKWRRIRNEENPEALANYDVFVEQYKATKVWKKRSHLEDEIKTLFDEITTEKSMSRWSTGKKAAWHPDLFKVTLEPKHWEYKCWWVNNLIASGSAVKLALRLKKEHYNTQPIGEFNNARD